MSDIVRWGRGTGTAMVLAARGELALLDKDVSNEVEVKD